MALADYFGLHRCRPAAFMQQVCSGVGDIGTGSRNELQTFRTQDLSFPRTKGPYGELSFPGTLVLGERKFPGTFVPGLFRSRKLSFPENESSGELSFLGPFVPGNFRSHYPIGLVAAFLRVLNYCMLGYDFTLMMLTPL